jgi:hypothetical protein
MSFRVPSEVDGVRGNTPVPDESGKRGRVVKSPPLEGPPHAYS